MSPCCPGRRRNTCIPIDGVAGAPGWVALGWICFLGAAATFASLLGRSRGASAGWGQLLSWSGFSLALHILEQVDAGKVPAMGRYMLLCTIVIVCALASSLAFVAVVLTFGLLMCGSQLCRGVGHATGEVWCNRVRARLERWLWSSRNRSLSV
jgi:hypothetical protein